MRMKTVGAALAALVALSVVVAATATASSSRSYSCVIEGDVVGDREANRSVGTLATTCVGSGGETVTGNTDFEVATACTDVGDRIVAIGGWLRVPGESSINISGRTEGTTTEGAGSFFAGNSDSAGGGTLAITNLRCDSGAWARPGDHRYDADFHIRASIAVAPR